MAYQAISVFISLVALGLLFFSAKMLINKQWLLGFLRGFVGFICLGFALLLALSAKDVFSYRVAENDRMVVTVSFRHKDGDNYQVELQEASGAYYVKDIQGQQWQLNARMFKWTPLMAAMGLKIGFRLENIQGRYLDLQRGKSPIEPIGDSKNNSSIDVWQFIKDRDGGFSSVDAYVSSPGFISMADGAIFEVVLTGTNLSARPLNQAAKTALATW